MKYTKTYKYILAWVITSIASNILVRLSDSIIYNITVSDPLKINGYLILSGMFSILFVSGTFIVTYNFFNSLNVKKVMIYIYILGTLGLLASIGGGVQIYKSLGVSMPKSIIYSTIIYFVISVLIIRYYFKNKPDRWY